MSKNKFHEKILYERIIEKAEKICKEIGAKNFDEAILFLEENKKRNEDKK